MSLRDIWLFLDARGGSEINDRAHPVFDESSLRTGCQIVEIVGA